MSIKNAFKIVLSRFEIVGEILLLLFIMLLVFCGLGAIYVQPILRAAVDLNLSEAIANIFSTFFSGGTFSDVFTSIKEVFVLVKQIFIRDEGIVFDTFVVPFLFFITFILLFNMHELPLCKVLEARMSSNAKISLMGNTISLSGKSALYVLVKLLVVAISDAIIFTVLFGCYKLFSLLSITFFIPFALLLLYLVLISIRKCFTITWVQEIVVGEKKIFPAFAESVKSGFSHFWYTFAGYFVCLIISITVNGLMALLTFGVGLIVSIPVTLLFFKSLEMTAYYSWKGKRYYLDGHRIVGNEQELNEKLE